ncbi:hypothetical protein [Nocardia sp. NRRL S-836]|uniref:hypothetical protein n=1 Tax=Nocardia sp. NRRL S-836 TaxID=1519492 RepID=UPI0006ADF21E|nr:hypothetical protein [Nocardia sp. NRRL S-836]KOV84773.1 hypothetical protein ADL03_16035 [Nocardia sp. NRRL S-836]
MFNIGEAHAFNSLLGYLMDIDDPDTGPVDRDVAHAALFKLAASARKALQGAGLGDNELDAAFPQPGRMWGKLIAGDVKTYTAETCDGHTKYGPKLDIASVREYASKHGLQLMATNFVYDDCELVEDYTPDDDAVGDDDRAGQPAPSH